MLILKFFLILAGAALYRMGGKKEFDTLYRDAGVSVCVALALLMRFGLHWPVVLSLGCTWGALTTYFGFVNPWIGKPKEDKEWWNWALVGFFCALAALPTAVACGAGWWLFWRMIFLTVTMAIWRESVNNDDWEEAGAGALIIWSIFCP